MNAALLPSIEHVRVGTVDHFMLHTPVIANPQGEATSKPHLLAQLSWNQYHPGKNALEYGILLSASVTKPTYSASFMPFSRIISLVQKVLSVSFFFNYI